MDVSLRAGCWERMQDGGKRRQGHEKETERDGEREKKKESGDPLSVVMGDWQVSALEMLLRVTRPHNTAVTHWL